jgi:hypothetical protein
MKQTAIEWLQECLNIHLTYEQQIQFEGFFQQAKEIEKEQIISDWIVQDNKFQRIVAEEYYNKTYKGEEINNE